MSILCKKYLVNPKCVWYIPSLPSRVSSGHALEDSRHYGWDVPEGVGHKWEKMVENIQAHIASLNWGYRTALRKKSVKYLNALTEFVDPHTIKVRGRERRGEGEREREREREGEEIPILMH